MTRIHSRAEHGHTLIESVAALALSGLIVAMTVPALGALRARTHMRGASRELAAILRATRSRAIAEGRSLGLVFERDGRGWRYTLHGDGNGDGVRSSDLSSGIDPVVDGPRRLGERWPGIDFGFLALARIRKLPPSTGWMASSDDPVQFGASDIAVFSPRGDASSGSFYLTDSQTQMEAVVMFGPTARIRLYRYDTNLEAWLF